MIKDTAVIVSLSIVAILICFIKLNGDINLTKALCNEILADVGVLKLYKNVNHFASNYGVFYPACFIEKLTEERRRELKEFLFHCR